MPLVVSRWQVTWSKKCCAARKAKELTVCGALAASSFTVTAPQLVFSVMVYAAVVLMVMAGSVFHCLDVGVPAAGVVQPARCTEPAFAAVELAVAEALAVALAEAVAAFFL